MPVLIIEGIDHIGKDTLIDQYCTKFAPYYNIEIVHPGKPPKDCNPVKYQDEYFLREMSRMNLYANDSKNLLIYNRAHLGECVYGMLYRGRNFDDGLQYEKYLNTHTYGIQLIVLAMHDVSIRKFDNDAIDFSKGNVENLLFRLAYHSSIIQTKRLVYVDDNGKFRQKENIFRESLV